MNSVKNKIKGTRPIKKNKKKQHAEKQKIEKNIDLINFSMFEINSFYSLFTNHFIWFNDH